MCTLQLGNAAKHLVLQRKRITALVAAGVLLAVGTPVAFAASHFYPARNQDDMWTLILGGGLAVLFLGLGAMFLFFGVRRPDRIVIDTRTRTIRFERRRKPLRLGFDDIVEVAVKTENRSRASETSFVHPVMLVTRDGASIQVDFSSDAEEMIELAAKLRDVIGTPLR